MDSNENDSYGQPTDQDENSRTIKARRLGPAQTSSCSFSKSGDFPDHTCTERLLGGQRGVMSNVL